MNNLSSFMISFCSCSVLLGFLYMLCPSGSMKDSIRYVFCLCFVCCIFSGVISIQKTDFDAFNSADNTEIITEESSALTAQAVFAEALNSADINFRKIDVDTNKLPDGSITIIRVTVYTDAAEEEIISVIGSDSYEVYVINE